MNTKGYLDLSTGQLSSTLGGSDIQFPKLPFGTEVTLGLRLSEQLEGRAVEADRTVTSFRASVGRIDTRPESGSFNLEIGSEGTPDTTANLTYDSTAQEVQDAINAISSSQMTALGAATVELLDESFIVTFANETTASYAQPTEITIYDENSLFPVSFLRSRASRFNGKWRHDLRLIQAPVASTSTLTTKLPDPPYVTEDIAGSDPGVGGTLTPEVQILHVPRDFRAGYQLKRNSIHSTTLTRADGVAQIEEALAPLADEGGIFRVEQGLDGQALISFEGDMAGIDQDLIEVVVVGDDSGYLTFTLDFNTAELAALMRDAEDGEITLPFEIEMEIEDPDNSAITYNRKVHSSTLTLIRTLNWDGLASAANVDWLRPPIDEVYGGFDYSQVSNGQLHYSDTVGDGVATTFVVDHNLDVNAHNVIVKQVSTGNLLVLGTDFSVTETNSNSLTVTALSGAPASGDWRVTVLGLELTSFFDPHTHPISDIIGLQAILDDYGLRITALEDRTGGGGGGLRGTDDGGGQAAHWQLPPLFEVFPSRVEIPDPNTRLVDLDTSQLGRARGLLAAVHDAQVEDLPSTVPTPSSEYVGRVFQNNTGGTVLLTGGKGIRSARLDDGGFAACDGRLWYQVERYGEHASPIEFTTDFASDENQLAATDNEFPDGTIVTVNSTDTPPAPLVAGSDYEVINREDDAIELTSVGGSTPITLTDDGVGTHTITKKAETSYYPKAFERELFQLPVNDRQLRLKSRFELRFALELAVLKSNTAAQWAVAIEVGEKTTLETPSKTGKNIESIVWRGTPLLEQAIVISPISTVHRFGMVVERKLIDEIDTLTATSLFYGTTEATVAPKSANFILRARLIRFDTEDGQSDPSGFTAIKGFTIETPGVQTPASEGTAFIN